MAVRDLYLSATGISGIDEITLSESMSQAAVQIEITALSHTLAVGSTCTVDLGYTDEHQVVLSNGIVQSIRYSRPDYHHIITIKDALKRAEDYFIAPDDPEQAYQANNISAENLVRDLLSMAGITNYVGDASGFTFGVQTGNKKNAIKLITSWNMIENINRICGFITYADANGQVHFTSRKPYIVAGDTAKYTFQTGNAGEILRILYTKSDEKIRNRIVVYGAPGISAVRSASSPYLPAGFYKSMVIAHELIDTAAQAGATGDVNLTMFNRLTETVQLTALGKPSLRCRDILAVSEAFTGLTPSTLWVAFSTRHTISKAGYMTEYTLVH